MRMAWAAIALSAAAWGWVPAQDPKDGPAYQARVKIDDV